MKKLKIVSLVIAVVIAAVVLAPANARRQLVAMVTGVAGVNEEPRVIVKLAAGPQQPRVSPDEAGIDMAGIQAAVDYAAARNTRALVIGRGGHIVFEKYWDGSTLDTPVDLSGFTPALSALLLGVVMNDERSINLDAPLSGYIAAWAEDPRGAVTLRQLVTRGSGFASATGWPWPGTRTANYASGADLRATLLAWPLEAAPRVGQSPVDVSADILALALEGRLHLRFDKLLAERLWQPIEGGEFSLARGARAGCCIRARIGDWMRIGEVLANNGVFEGNQLTPPHFVSLMLKPAFQGSPAGFFTRVDGTFAAHDVARLEDSGKQRLWVVPSLRLVILRVGAEPSASQGWNEPMIPDSIIRSTRDWHPASAGEGMDPSRFAPH
ncbi:MAG: serine hydrolase domain-containing protein [Pseudomonadota bacterium]